MFFKARIQWVDDKEEADVIVTTFEPEQLPEETDDKIFFYFEDEEDIKTFMKIRPGKFGSEEFIVLEYKKMEHENTN